MIRRLTLIALILGSMAVYQVGPQAALAAFGIAWRMPS